MLIYPYSLIFLKFIKRTVAYYYVAVLFVKKVN